MKKIVALLVLVMMIASAFVVSADAVPTDTFENELYDVVAPIIDVPATEASSHGEVIYSEIENYPEKILTRVYADGARIRYAFTGEDFEHVSIDFADEAKRSICFKQKKVVACCPVPKLIPGSMVNTA